jgi:AraC family transcriptional regulator of adaptative response / DNA-3-methyladenine glycosylase II
VPASVVSRELPYRRPFDWGWMTSFLGTRAILGVENVDATAYRRVVRLDAGKGERRGWIEIAPVSGKAALRASVSASLQTELPGVLARVDHLMDLSCRPRSVARALGQLAAANAGVRVPGVFDGFEVAVRAILGQQITVAAARTLAGRFAGAFGTPVRTPFDGLTTAFPSYRDIAGLRPASIARLGVIGARARAILAIARAMRDDGLVLAPGARVESTLEQLRGLPGIGEWTAQYIAMRALAWRDAFPHTDYGVMKAMAEKDPRRVLATAEPWRPWRAYAVMHLWKSLHQAN